MNGDKLVYHRVSLSLLFSFTYSEEGLQVRSVEDGFAGSWHNGEVIDCGHNFRYIEYEYIHLDDGSAKLIESVTVTSAIEGSIPRSRTPPNYRGCIRSVPPRLRFDEWSFHYGLCVDAFHECAWWEGVVFDHDDGSLSRLIFFPDLGDEMRLGIDKLRITQDWNEVTEEWKPRGLWVFLEVLEKYERDWPQFASPKQIWYDVRTKEEFLEKISEWTAMTNLWDWDNLVREVVSAYMDLNVEKFLDYINSDYGEDLAEVQSKKRKTIEPGFSLTGGVSGGLLSEPAGEIILKPEGYLTDSRTKKRKISSLGLSTSDVGFGCQLEEPRVNAEGGDISQTEDKGLVINPLNGTNSCSHDEDVFVQPQDLLVLPSDLDLFACASGSANEEGVRIPLGIEDATHGVIQNKADGHWGRNDPTSNEHIGNPTTPNANAMSLVGFITSGKEETENTLSRESEAQGGGSVQDDRKSRKDSSCSEPNNKPAHLQLGANSIWLPVVPDLIPGAGYFPDAIAKYSRNPKNRSKQTGTNREAKMHLLYLGWKVEYKKYKKMYRFRFTSPEGKPYLSLIQVCQALMESAQDVQIQNPHNDQQILACKPAELFDSSSKPVSLPCEGDASPLCAETLMLNREEVGTGQLIKEDVGTEEPCKDMVHIEPKHCPRAVIVWYLIGLKEQTKEYDKIGAIKSSELRSKSRGHLSSLGWKFWYVNKNGNREMRYCSPKGKVYNSLRTACAGCITGGGCPESSTIIEQLKKRVTARKVSKHQLVVAEFASEIICQKYEESMPLPDYQSEKDSTESCGSSQLTKQAENLDSTNPTSVLRSLRSSKRARRVVRSSPMHHTPRTILSWLIDNNVVLPRAKVHYIGRKNCPPMAEGRITCNGIKCSCCQKVFTLSGFGVHAGGSYHRPAANIFLEDGRSLLQCQEQINKPKMLKPELHRRIKSNRHSYENDYICSVCHYGGTLLLCDQCPSSFHLSCLGLKDLPDGKWFCPSCRCGICGKSEFNGKTEQFTDASVLYCDQCEREYHVGCLKRRGHTKVESCPKGNWFCSKNCEKIFMGLRKLIGKPLSVGMSNFSWTLLKSIKDDSCLDSSGNEDTTEHHSKLNVALSVMHECFEPIKEPRTKSDLVEDVIFSKCSELNRLNFQGFYTVLLEREDEIISVATVRVFGEKVAEVPLIGTRVQFRRMGMCRLLMNELEKKLMELGVERLFLPAIPQVLHTWTTSFGFSTMTNSERLKFLEYTFLDFQDTTMCQKLLT
ncbi:PREDICTED: uncharacterized protein LOC104602702 [Nelumbo nucifera]|uniref:Uncharacterized protein LOC104602702 n=1 Tax=Nelumbo nucifera TaxID=4432 RepID=A0A1U8Q815_NELNU|nr:PREDICTED: uncharacterized protein LOC104602702 [Nelumbo nucifera]